MHSLSQSARHVTFSASPDDFTAQPSADRAEQIDEDDDDRDALLPPDPATWMVRHEVGQ